MRMDWDKDFRQSNNEGTEDAIMGKAPQYLSEYEEVHLQKVQIVRCGKILWRSIIYMLYCFLLMFVVRSQIKASNMYNLNSEL